MAITQYSVRTDTPPEAVARLETVRARIEPTSAEDYFAKQEATMSAQRAAEFRKNVTRPVTKEDEAAFGQAWDQQGASNKPDSWVPDSIIAGPSERYTPHEYAHPTSGLATQWAQPSATQTGDQQKADQSQLLTIVDTAAGRAVNVIVDGRFAAAFPVENLPQLKWLVEQTNVAVGDWLLSKPKEPKPTDRELAMKAMRDLCQYGNNDTVRFEAAKLLMD